MIQNYSGKFNDYTLFVRNSFIQIRNDVLCCTITLHYAENVWPEFNYTYNDMTEEETIVFKTPILSLIMTFRPGDEEFAGTSTLEIQETITGNYVLTFSNIPNCLARGLKDIGQDRKPLYGRIIPEDEDSDSGYSSNEEFTATFSDTSF
jgi:hypothetical protein